MLRIHCPVCGLRDETEFTYGEDASIRRPDMNVADPEIWHDYVFIRENPRGPHKEYWHHVAGCRQWIVVERDTLTHEMFSSVLAREVAV
ncbi:sarcosine oxidase subunit delta [Mesorhizobium sp. M0239]|uniref:sarcosine oxidase subunit delta n=1 Tax=Mesorhizobium sp. M0239 TaxID=2956924 RepID=UPI0033377C1C